jgi:hypothetical protein
MAEEPLVGANPFAAGRRSNKLRLILISSAVILLLILGFFFYTRSRQSSLLIQAPAEGLTIALNGQTVTPQVVSQGLFIPVYAGQYRLQIDKTGNLPYIQDIKITAGEQVAIRPVFTLLPTASQSPGQGISFVRPSPDQKYVYYLGDNGTRLYRTDTSSHISIPLTEKPLQGVTDIQWSSDPNVALITQADGVYLQEVPKFDFRNQRFVKIAGPELISPVWDPNGTTRIAAGYFTASGEHRLILADKVLDTLDRKSDLNGFTNPKLVWSPNSDYLAIINRSVDANQNNLWIYKLSDGSFRSLTNNGSVIDALFNPDASKLLVEMSEASGNVLRSITIETGEISSTSTTGVARKAAWKNNDSFFLPEDTGTALVLHHLNGAAERVPYSLPDALTVEGMFYFESNQTLVFYTQTAVYTVSLAR